MLRVLPLLIAAVATPALAQFPPPGVFACKDSAGRDLGVLTLYVGGDYMWDGTDGRMGIGQVSSAGNAVEALTGPLKTDAWIGEYADAMGRTTYRFTGRDGLATCD